MRSIAMSSLCRLMSILTLWTPYHVAHSEMVGAAHAVTAPRDHRSTVLNFLIREDVARQLQSFGIDSETVKSRVAALTDAEARALAAKINALPAGGQAGYPPMNIDPFSLRASSPFGWYLLILAILVVFVAIRLLLTKWGKSDVENLSDP